jgi:hypothetical protein
MHELAQLSDEVLLENTRLCARNERERTALFVAHLAEVYRRDLALKRGFSSIYAYARQELRLSEAMAWERVNAARLSLELPETIEKLSRGELTLASAGELFKTIREAEKPGKVVELPKIQPSLSFQVPATVTPQKLALSEKRELLAQVTGKTRRESVQVLQSWKNERAGVVSQEKPRHERKFALTDEELAQFDRLRDLLSHKLGTRDPQAVFLWLMKQGLQKLDPVLQEERAQKRKAAVSARPLGNQETPHLRKRKAWPAALKRRITLRDLGRCQHTDPKTGRKCESTAFLDLDHRTPLSQGGTDDESNLRLSCASHNRRRPKWSDEDQPL